MIVKEAPVIRNGDPVIVQRDDGYYVEVWGQSRGCSAGPTDLETAKKVARSVGAELAKLDN